MRNGQNKRMRGRNNRKGGGHHHNPFTRVYESNGPDVKIRGTANHVAEKYIQLARDAQSSGDHVGAENFYQHAEHYFRLLAAANEQFRQNNPNYQPNNPQQVIGNDARDEVFDDSDEDEFGTGPEQQQQPQQPQFGTRDPQPFLPRDTQFYAPNDQQQGHRPPANPQQDDGGVDRLPSFITGGAQPQPQQGQPQHPQGQGYDNGGGERHQGDRGHQGDRYGFRRRRRHRGPRNDVGGMQGGSYDSDDSPAQN